MSDTVRIDTELDRALRASFEGMAFEEALPAPDSEFDWDGEDLCWARIYTIDPPVGELTIAMGPALAERIAGATLGMLDGVEPEDLLGVLEELMNTVGGMWLAQLQREDAPIQLGLPKSGRGPCTREQATAVTIYQIEEDRLAIVRRSASP